MEHTPLKASEIDVAVAYHRAYELRDKRGILVAYAQSPDDAKSIVRAVNNHAKLLAALKKLTDWVARAERCDVPWPSALQEANALALATIEAAKK